LEGACRCRYRHSDRCCL